MKFEKLKGTKDFAPEEKIVRQFVIDKIRVIFEKYGFSPLETSILERLDTLTSKFAGGDEIIKEIYKLKDQGKRDLGLRYDLTVPLARYIGLNPSLKMPFKRYEIGRVFRDGPIKLGRLREFWQCDVDVIGAKGMIAEAELLSLASEFFKEIGLKVSIRINNRKILNGIIEYSGINKDKEGAILSIDKLEKYGIEEVKKELKGKGFSDKSVVTVLEAISINGSNDQILKSLSDKIKDKEGLEGVKEVEDLLGFLEMFKTEVSLDVSLARGLAYYTGTIFEVFISDGSFKSSLAGGGRWDDMIGKFLNSKREYPAVGISFGLEPICAILSKNNTKKSVTQVYIAPIGTLKECVIIASEFRKNGIRIEIDLIGRGPSKNLSYADSFKIPFVALVGEDEVKVKKIKIKDMRTGDENLLDIKEAIEKIKIMSKS